MISPKPLLVFPFFASASSSSPTLPSPPPKFTTLRYSSTSRSPLLRPAFRHYRTTHSRPSSFGGDDSAGSARRPSPATSTHQELLDLGEAVGTQSRGLSQEQISLLPVTKYKCGFFSRKKTRRERCVICQMEYRRGNLQMTLPCKHVYHASCVTRWLSINKVCPVCFAEVPGE